MTVSSATHRLRELLASSETEFLMEAHSGLSARIVAEAGFKGIWASGLAISAQCGVRDHNELSWTQVLDVVELMVDAATIPVLLDGDTGYGNFNNLRRLVRKLEQIGGAGVCIEDKCFPKTNSYIRGETQPLADIDEFCGKIKAGKDTQLDDAFCLVARVEALIAGWGMEEALRRAEAYHAAGADAILIHSKRSDPAEILRFSEEWANRCPLVIVPTSYSSTPTDVFRRAGVRLVVWANALIRGAVAEMQLVARTLYEKQTLVEVESEIAPLAEIFRLQQAEELEQAERRYIPCVREKPRALILGATRGRGLEPVTSDRPKIMLPIAGRSLLEHLVASFKRQGVHELHVVAGYRADAVQAAGVSVRTNAAHENTGELQSLWCALDVLSGDSIVLYGDLLFRDYILGDLLNAADAPISVVVDSSPLPERGNVSDLAYCSASDDRGLYRTDVVLERITEAQSWSGRRPDGRWIGMLRARAGGISEIRSALCELRKSADFEQLGLPDLLNALVSRHVHVRVLYVHGHWLDVNDLSDLERANAFARGPRAASEVRA